MSQKMGRVESLLGNLHLRDINQDKDLGEISKWFDEQSRRVAGIASDKRRQRRNDDARHFIADPILDGDDYVLAILDQKMVHTFFSSL